MTVRLSSGELGKARQMVNKKSYCTLTNREPSTNFQVRLLHFWKRDVGIRCIVLSRLHSLNFLTLNSGGSPRFSIDMPFFIQTGISGRVRSPTGSFEVKEFLLIVFLFHV